MSCGTAHNDSQYQNSREEYSDGERKLEGSGDEEEEGSYKLSSPVKPSAVFQLQRFNYQEAKFFRSKLLEKLLEEEQ